MKARPASEPAAPTRQLAAYERAGLKASLASWPPSGEPAAAWQAWRAGRLRASQPPEGRPGELAAFGRAGRRKTSLASWPPSGEPAAARQAWRAGRLRASRPPQGKLGELAAFGRAGRPLHFETVLHLMASAYVHGVAPKR